MAIMSSEPADTGVWTLPARERNKNDNDNNNEQRLTTSN